MKPRYFIAAFGTMEMIGYEGTRKVIQAPDLQDAKRQFLDWYMTQPELMQQGTLRLGLHEEDAL